MGILGTAPQGIWVPPRTAYLIAADDSPAKTKAQADNICSAYDGTKNTRADATINSMLAALVPGDNLVIAPGTFNLLNPITPPAGVTVEIQGKLKIADAITSLLTANANLGQPDMTVADASKFFIGQWIGITDTSYAQVYVGGGRAGDGGYIINIVGNTITLHRNLIQNYTVANAGYVCSAPCAILIQGVSYVNVIGAGGEVDGNRVNNATVYPLGVHGIDPHYMGSMSEWRTLGGVVLFQSNNCRIEKLKVYNACWLNITEGYGNHNKIIDCETYGEWEKSILFFSTNYSKAIHNYCHDTISATGTNGGDGIHFYHDNFYALAQSNILKNCTRYGLAMKGTGQAGTGPNYSKSRANIAINCQMPFYFGFVMGKNFESDGDICVNPGTGLNGFWIDSKAADLTARARITNAQAIGMGATGFSVNEIDGVELINCKAIGCKGAGFSIGWSAAASNVVLDGCQAWDTIWDGLYANGIQVGSAPKTLIRNCIAKDSRAGGAKTQRYGLYLVSWVTGAIIKDNDFTENALAPIYDSGTAANAHKIYGQHTKKFMDLLANTANHIVAAQDLTAATPIVCAIANQPDDSRNVTLTITDGDTSISAFSIAVVGIDAQGRACTETFVFAGGLVQTGNVSFDTITSVTVTSITGANAGDVLDVGIGSKLGVSPPFLAVGNVYKVKKNTNGNWLAGCTVNATYYTVDVSTGGAIVAGDDFTIYYTEGMQ